MNRKSLGRSLALLALAALASTSTFALMVVAPIAAASLA